MLALGGSQILNAAQRAAPNLSGTPAGRDMWTGHPVFGEVPPRHTPSVLEALAWVPPQALEHVVLPRSKATGGIPT